VGGDALLRVGPLGANGAVWLAALLGALALMRRRLRPGLHGEDAAATLVGLAFAFGLAWRDSVEVKLLDLAVVGAMVAVPFVRLVGARPWTVSMSKLGAAGVLAGSYAAFGMPVLAVSDVRWCEVRRERRWVNLLAAARGVAIAVPLLAAFGAMLAAADAVFADLVADVLRIDLKAAALHLVVAGFFAWVAGGVLRGALLARPLAPFWKGLPGPPHLGVVEIGIVLGLLDLLFLSFVVVQIRYLFGGALYVGSIPGLTYAEYARRGFFELVGVAALAIPLLLVTDWLLRRENDGDERAYRVLAGGMAILLAAMMVSAVRRMLLYTGEYGLSELRVYTLALMGWLAMVLVWFTLTVLRGRRDRFAFGALAAGVAVAAALNVANTDGLVADVNLKRAAAGRFDAAYAASLSADAVPALVAGLDRLDPAHRAAIAAALARRWRPLQVHDWRTWSVAREAAVRALDHGPAELREKESGDGASRWPGCGGR
jgi:hypothetical protein